MPATEISTLAAVSAALDAASIRQQVAAANIANAHVAGYTPLAVSFSARMEALSGAGFLSSGAVRVEVTTTPLVNADGSAQAVRLDDEMARVSQNALHYQALVRGLKSWMGLLTTAVSDGKR